MGITDSLGISNFGSSLGIASSFVTILVVFIIFVIVVGVAIISAYFFIKRARRKAYKNLIPMFLEVAGKIQRIGQDWGKELFIPDSNISLYFLKDRKLYIARPTRAMAKDEFWYKILENGEWVNFNLSSHPEDNTLALANYDHRDTRYAYVNLKDIIKKNYKDKATTWWKEYSGLITIVVIAIMMIASMWFFFWKSGKMIEQMVPISNNMKEAANAMANAVRTSQSLNSGVIQG
jgi:uncharacterized membrane protein